MQTGWHDPVGRDCWVGAHAASGGREIAIHSAGAAVVLDPDADGHDGSTDAVGDSMIESSTSMASSGGG
jgi:hypothetical protein